MINKRLKLWSNKFILEDLLAKDVFILPNSLNINPTIVINISSKKAVINKRNLLPIVLALELISGQKGILTIAKSSLATFKLKQGMALGLKLNLHKSFLWDFFDKFIHIILPSLKYYNQFKSLSYDRFGNFSIGFKDLSIFPELSKLREDRHLLTNLNNITGADILFIFNKNSKNNYQFVVNPLQGFLEDKFRRLPSKKTFNHSDTITI